MKHRPAALALAVILAPALAFAQAAPRRLSRAVLEDKIRGGWAGQMIGVSYGAPTEFRSNGKIIEGNLNNYLDWTPAALENAINQDDLYVEMTFAEVMDTVGLDATTEQYGEMFKDSKYELWHANAGARRLLNRGITAPMSGHPKYNMHADDIDFQIESDFIGIMTPGLPREANKYADRVGRVMNWGDGLYGGMFFSGMYAAAFFENDPRKVVEQGLRSIPAESAYGRIIRRRAATGRRSTRTTGRRPGSSSRTSGTRTTSARTAPCTPFNIDAKLNGAYVALGLLYGKRRFREDDRGLDPRRPGLRLQSVERGRHPGRDARLRERSPTSGRRASRRSRTREFAFTQYSFNEIVASTLTRAYKVIEGAGGSGDGDGGRGPGAAAPGARSSSGTPACPSSGVEVVGRRLDLDGSVDGGHP